jgi:hypothetical protein
MFRPKIILHDPNTDNETVSTIVDEEDELSSGHDSFKYLNPKDSIKGRRASSPESRHAMDVSLYFKLQILKVSIFCV